MYDTDTSSIVVENKKYVMLHRNGWAQYATIYRTQNNSYFLYVRTSFDDVKNEDIEKLDIVEDVIKIIQKWAESNQIDADATRKALEALGEKIEDA